ncbi:MAG: thioesterase family protein [Acidobacteria bacterium]|nr:thioesterase family protein [Acidobacteriota bacterium]
MAGIPIGATGAHKILVTPEVAVDFLGLEGARVLGTPFLIAFLEMTARNAIKPHLEDGFDTVGTEVNVRHLAATPLGMHVSFHAEVLEVNDRRVVCKVEAFDEKEKISEGTHERFVVHVARFASRVQAKLASSTP